MRPKIGAIIWQDWPALAATVFIPMSLLLLWAHPWLFETGARDRYVYLLCFGMVGAGCVVPPGKTLASGFVYIGNPYKQLRPISETERRILHYSPANYVKLKDVYLAEQVGLDDANARG